MMSTPSLPAMLPLKRDVRLALTVWTIWSSRQRALSEVNVHCLSLPLALDTYAEGINRQNWPRAKSRNSSRNS